MAPLLGYWNCRGYGQPIRLLLTYLGVEFDERRYSFGQAPEYDGADWFDIKYTLGMDTPNLPYYIDGEVKFTQFSAIMRHLGRHHNLNGSTAQERQRVDMASEEAKDLFGKLVMFSLGPGRMDKEDEEKYIQNGRDAFQRKCLDLQNLLGDRPWFAGDNVTIADFSFYEFMDFNRLFYGKDALSDVPQLAAYMERFEALPAIAAYRRSEQCIHWPVMGPSARWGGGDSAGPAP